MSFFLMFLITIVDSVAVSYLTKRSFGRTAAFVNLSLIILLYLAGLGQRLDIGMYIFFALSLGLVGTCIGLSCRRKDWKAYWGIIKNPLFGIYVLLGLTFGIGMLYAQSFDWDELTHWALVTKNMYTYNNFGNLGDTTTMFNRYVPATGIFMYAFQFFNPSFVNGNLFSAFDVLTVSLLLPLPDKFGVKKPVPFALTLVGSLVLLCFFKYGVYFNLRVDALIGVMGAYLYFVYWADRGHCNWFTLTEMSLGCAVLTLSKTSGVGLAAIALVFVVLDVLLRGRGNLKTFFNKKYRIAFLLLPILAIVLAKVSWNLYCDINEVRTGWNMSELNLQTFWSYLTQPNDFQRVVTQRFFENFFVGKLGWRSGCFNQPFLLYMPAFLLVTILLARKKQGAYAWSMFATSMAVLIIYGIINLILYIFSFSYTESLRLMSYSRYYISCFILVSFAWLAFSCEILLGDIQLSPKTDRRIWQGLMVLAVAFFVVAASVLNVVKKNEAKRSLAPYRNWIECVSTLSDTDHIYYACANTDVNSKESFIVRYLATPTRCSGYHEGGAYTDGRKQYSSYNGDVFKWEMSKEDLSELLQEYDYFFLSEQEDKFAEKYGALFENGEVYEQTCYVVRHNKDGSVTLVLQTQQ